jgi:hypothetical protein
VWTLLDIDSLLLPLKRTQQAQPTAEHALTPNPLT